MLRYNAEMRWRYTEPELPLSAHFHSALSARWISGATGSTQPNFIGCFILHFSHDYSGLVAVTHTSENIM